MPDDNSDHDPEERDIYIHINLHHDYGNNTAHVRIDDHRGAHVIIDDVDHDLTYLDVCRALHDARPALYHGGEPDDDAAACSWCADLADRATATGDGMTPC